MTPDDAAALVARASTTLRGSSLRVLHALRTLDGYTADGFSARASGTEATGNSSTPGTLGYASPVERGAFARDDAARARRRLLDLCSEIEHLAAQLDQTTRLWAAETPTPSANDARSIIKAEGCRSCARIGVWSEIKAMRLCDFCYSFKRTHNDVPPASILHDVKVEHRRITAAQVATSLAAVRAERKRARRNR